MCEMINYYQEVVKGNKANEQLTFEQSGIGTLLVQEYYCIDPNCNCNEVRFDFHIKDDQDLKEEPVLSFVFNLDTRDSTKIKVNNSRVSSNLMIMNIFNLHDTNNDFLWNHYQQAKAFGVKKLGKTISTKMVKSGNYVLYGDVFDTLDQPTYTLKHMGNTYSIIDAYCAEPTCFCQDVMLYIMKEHANENEEHVVVVKYHFVNKTYEIEKNTISVDEVEKVMSELKHNDAFISLVQSHYDNMKIIGEESLKSKKPIRTKKIGRNEPCPCGSGKKYKKCCEVL